MLKAFLITTGSYDDVQTFGVIVAADEATAQYHLDRAQLDLVRAARASESAAGDLVRVLRMQEVDLINQDVLISREDDDPATGRRRRGAEHMPLGPIATGGGS